MRSTFLASKTSSACGAGHTLLAAHNQHFRATRIPGLPGFDPLLPRLDTCAARVGSVYCQDWMPGLPGLLPGLLEMDPGLPELDPGWQDSILDRLGSCAARIGY